tara:strand:- start:10 stop:573 length:564 start_codon:yes stop_codon:yes gene_type:complete
MFIIKNFYYLYIENTQSINLDQIKKNKKISIIYRNNHSEENLENVIKFKKKCSNRKFKLYIANNYKLAQQCKADGLYLSSYNKKKIYEKYKQELIGSAHSYKEIYEKIKQGCKKIIFSRLFKTKYKNKKNYMGVTKFNLLQKKYLITLIPLGGINNDNLLKLNLVFSNGFALLSAIKKKPAISNRLF